MLLQFSVKNFLSIKDECSLSLLAANSIKDCEQNLIDVELAGLKGVKVLKGLGIYGPNASGKTSVLKALDIMKFLVVQSAAILPAEHLPYTPFALCEDCLQNPTELFVSFVHDSVRYEYEFHYHARRVVFEELSAFPSGKRQRWFTRKVLIEDESPGLGVEEFKFSTHLNVSNEVRNTVRPNSLLLSMGAQFNNDKLFNVYRWFQNECLVVNSTNQFDLLEKSAELFSNKSNKEYHQFIQMMDNADLGISGLDIDVHERDVPLVLETQVEGAAPQIQQVMGREVTHDVRFIHKAESGHECAVSLDNESSGTQVLFRFGGMFFDALNAGKTVVIDELDTSLHPLLERALLKMFFSAEVNKNGAQIIFVSHNPLLLSGDVLRRDQIWFTEKDVHGVTHLYPLTDFSPRKQESLLAGYMSGRYGGIPIVPDGLGLG